MATVKWIMQTMEAWAPTASAEPWDNVGLLIGSSTQQVKKILVALDATMAVINEAISGKYDCIVTHHAIVYTPLKRVTTDDAVGRKIISLIKHGISLYTAHTNLDIATGGVNDCLAKKLGIKDTQPMIKHATDGTIGTGRIGCLPEEMTLQELGHYVKKSLAIQDIRYCGDSTKKIKKVAMCGGSGMSYWQAAKECDVYITGDIKYSDANDALEANLSLLDITHYSGEIFILEAIVERLRSCAVQDGIEIEVNATLIDGQVFNTL